MTLIGTPVLVVVAITPVAVVCKKSGAPRFAEKSPLRCASVGTFESATRPMSWRMPWKSPKKVRSLTTGPPTAKPYWLRRKTGFFGLAAVAGANRLRAFSASLRRNSNTVPCSSFEPDLVVKLMTPPLKRPNSAGGELVSTLNSWMASITAEKLDPARVARRRCRRRGIH